MTNAEERLDSWAEQFRFHDVSDYPLVRLSGSGLSDGYAPQWVAEMETLLARGERFALVFGDAVTNESHEDRKARILWLKTNKKRLASLCMGIVSIEADKAMRVLKRAQGRALAAAFGLTLKVVPNHAEAKALARRLLSGEVLADAGET